MRIVVINGSPKMDNQSVTMQYIYYMQKFIPEWKLEVVNVGAQIRNLETNTEAFTKIISDIRDSDAVIWAFPVYYLLVASQLKRFIEMIYSSNSTQAFKSKPTFVLSTSIHFLDNLAMNYMHEICDDLSMNYFDGFSADMEDLSNSDFRQNFVKFGRNFTEFVLSGKTRITETLPLTYRQTQFPHETIPIKLKASNKKILILTDEHEENPNLGAMTSYLASCFGDNIEKVNLRDVVTKGGCLGCIRCGYDYECVYADKDDFIAFYKEKVMPADIIFFAGSVNDRYLSAIWKQYFDRSFFHNHTTTLHGKQVAMLISGPLKQMGNLRTIFQAYFEIQHANLVGMIGDDDIEPAVLEDAIQQIAADSIAFSEQKYLRPQTFLGYGGSKIFRDDLWGRLRFPFVKDYQIYREMGYFKFPQQNIKRRLINAILIILSNLPGFRKEVYFKRMKDEMVSAQKKIVNSAGSPSGS